MATSSDKATGLELSLLTVAVMLSVVFTGLGSVTNKPDKWSMRRFVIMILAVFATMALALVALILVWLRNISLDAFSAVLVGLLPAVQIVPKLPLGLVQDRLSVWRVRALNPSSFTYLRHGDPCVCEPELQGCEGQTNYIRKEAGYRSFGDDKHEAWHGWVIRFNQHAVEVCDKANGDPYRWWMMVKKQAPVLLREDPADLGLRKEEEVLTALALAADIIAIGDLVFHCHYDRLKNAFESDTDFCDGLKATPYSLAKCMLQKIGLSEEWGEIKEDAIFPKTDASRKSKYRILFFMLTEKSHLFERRATVCGSDVAEILWETGNVKEITKTWLQQWGLTFRAAP